MNKMLLKNSKIVIHFFCSILFLILTTLSLDAKAMKCKRVLLDIDLAKIMITISETMTPEKITTVLTTARLEPTEFNINTIMSIYDAIQSHTKIDLMILDNTVFNAAKYKHIDEASALKLTQIIKSAWQLYTQKQQQPDTQKQQ